MAIDLTPLPLQVNQNTIKSLKLMRNMQQTNKRGVHIQNLKVSFHINPIAFQCNLVSCTSPTSVNETVLQTTTWTSPMTNLTGDCPVLGVLSTYFPSSKIDHFIPSSKRIIDQRNELMSFKQGVT